jgi:hypothetical protein
MNAEQADAMIALSRGSLGVPFVRYGRDLKKGLSCIGLVAVTARAHGATVPTLDAASFVQYSPMKRAVFEACNADFECVRLSETRKGDVLLFHIWSPGHPLIEHVGVVSGERPLTFIHASPPPLLNRVAEELLDAPMYGPYPTPWRNFVAGVYRFRD